MQGSAALQAGGVSNQNQLGEISPDELTNVSVIGDCPWKHLLLHRIYDRQTITKARNNGLVIHTKADDGLVTITGKFKVLVCECKQAHAGNIFNIDNHASR